MTAPSLTDIYEKLGSIQAGLEALRVSDTRALVVVDKHEARISELERKEARQAGMIATISGPLALFVAFLYDYIGGLIK